MLQRLINFLQQELSISPQSLQLGLKQSENNEIFLPLILFQYGIINLQQLELVFDWIDNQSSS